MTGLVDLNLTSIFFWWAQWSLAVDMMQLELQKVFGWNRRTHDRLGGLELDFFGGLKQTLRDFSNIWAKRKRVA